MPCSQNSSFSELAEELHLAILYPLILLSVQFLVTEQLLEHRHCDHHRLALDTHQLGHLFCCIHLPLDVFLYAGCFETRTADVESVCFGELELEFHRPFVVVFADESNMTEVPDVAANNILNPEEGG